MRGPAFLTATALSGVLLLTGCTAEGEPTVDDVPPGGVVTGDGQLEELDE